MSRVRLDNVELSDIQAISDLAALGRTNYAGSLRVAKLYALLAVAGQIELAIIETMPENRARILAVKLCDMHIKGIKKRITQVEAINMRKASNMRNQRTMADLASVLTHARSLSNMPRLNPSPGLPQVSPEVRTRIAAPIITDLNTPSIDQAYSNTIANITALEAERAKPALPNTEPIVTEITDNIKSINTGDKLGSVEDWLK